MSKKTESKIEVHNLNDAQRKRLKDGIDGALIARLAVETYKESFNDSIDTLADELGIDKGKLKKAVERIFKQDFFDKVKEQDEIETILQVSGNLATPFDDEDE